MGCEIMTFGSRLKKLRLENNWTQAYVGNAVGVSDRVVGYYETDNRFPKEERILTALAELFNVSVDYLLGKTDLRNYSDYHPSLTAKDERDIQKDLEKMMTDLDSGEAGPTSYGGELNLSDNDKEILKATLEQALRIIKLKNKETYTPNKYRKNNSNE